MNLNEICLYICELDITIFLIIGKHVLFSFLNRLFECLLQNEQTAKQK